MTSLDELAQQVHAHEEVDKLPFQRMTRVLQSLWRMDMGYPAGQFRGRPLGSSLKMPWARESLANFLSEEIRQVVRQEVLNPARNQGKLYGKPRIFNNLLSSQPLAFNLFAVLARDLDLAGNVFRSLSEGRIHQVTRVEFEHSPGRGDNTYTGDHSAFDVYVEYLTTAGGPAFVGIEVKYHEDLSNEPSRHHVRYDHVASAMGCFDPAATDKLRCKPLQQIWRDHLLAGSLVQAGRFNEGLFVMLSPAGNTACNQAIDAYRRCLTRDGTFAHWTLESVVAAIEAATDAEWIRALLARYLDFGRVRAAMDSI